ncbi:MAG: hypothetical protein HUU13_02595 [Burkholderiaceae bacterium]|nr:hypothetical protein [Burkholderiaceae bacterium]
MESSKPEVFHSPKRNRLAMLLHEMARLRQHHQFGRAAHRLLQLLHHRHTEHGVARTGEEQAAAGPGVLPEVARSA